MLYLKNYHRQNLYICNTFYYYFYTTAATTTTFILLLLLLLLYYCCYYYYYTTAAATTTTTTTTTATTTTTTTTTTITGLLLLLLHHSLQSGTFTKCYHIVMGIRIWEKNMFAVVKGNSRRNTHTLQHSDAGEDVAHWISC